MGQDSTRRRSRLFTGRSTTWQGFAILWVAVKRERCLFIVSTVGAALFGVLTVADAWVLG